MKQQTAYPFRNGSLYLLAVFLLPLLAKDVHYLFAHRHHDHHLHQCDVAGAHIHDPEHYTPENCSLCGVVYTQFFNDAAVPSLPVGDWYTVASETGYLQAHFTTTTHAIRPRGPPVAPSL